ncbi:MAG TPA: asparagine synthase-related protein [Sphingomicrobium sp.]|nr:asparagine synthase-related protein [Sphingomicrobium sp.]
MLALAWSSSVGASNRSNGLSARLGASLCAGIGGHAGTSVRNGLHLAYRPLHSSSSFGRAWQPAELPSGRIALFHGYFDNAGDIAAELATDEHDLPRLYGLAVERWHDDAERRIIGEYCAVIADPSASHLRLSRSPLRAPPLYYSHDERLTAVASVPRALFAAGVEQRLNEARIADLLMRNSSDDEASSFDEVFQLPLGSIVELEAGRPRVLRKWYDILDVPPVPVSDDAEVIARASDLLDQGVGACLRGFRRPGSTLSAGLDSPQVAVRALSMLPAGQRLPTFTFHPEAGFDGHVPRWKIGNERPVVEAFAAMHPGLDPHFTDNAGYEHDYRWNELFHLMGDTAGIPCTYVLHGLMAGAVREQCDVLLLAEMGNATFSDRGDSGFVEYFLTGRWRQLWLALTRPSIHRGSIARRFVSRSLSALLPDRIWGSLRQMVLGKTLLSEIAQPLSEDYRRASGADERFQRLCSIPDRYQPWSRRHSRMLRKESGDPAAFYQGLEQMYGVALRDPTAYRPFVEYCLGLPTRMFMRDGEMRWLAKQMARGIMPEGQRQNALNGWWDADWHLRIGRRRQAFLAELDRIGRDDRLGRMFDVPRLRAALEDWPEQTETDPQKAFAVQLAVPSALLAARFINWVEGRNQP